MLRVLRTMEAVSPEVVRARRVADEFIEDETA